MIETVNGETFEEPDNIISVEINVYWSGTKANANLTAYDVMKDDRVQSTIEMLEATYKRVRAAILSGFEDYA